MHRPRPWTPRWLTSIAAIGTLATVIARPGPALAQNADAEALFSEGERLEIAGDVADACDAFEASNRIEPRAGTMIRLGQCREHQGRVASAWSAYKDSLTRVKDPAKRRLAEARVAALEARLSYLTVLVPDTSRVDGLVIVRNGRALDAGLWNRAAPVDGGVYTIEGRAPGHEAWSTTVEVAAEVDRASVEVPRFKELRALIDRAPPPSEPGSATGLDEHAAAGAPVRLSGRRKLALGVAALSAAAVAGGVVLGLQARRLEGDAVALCPMPAMCPDALAARGLNRDGGTRALQANVAFGLGGAAAIGAVVLWLTGAPRAAASEIALHPQLRPGFSGVDVTVRF